MSKNEQKKFFDNENNVRDYIDSCEAINGRFLIEILKTHLAGNSTVLELGIGAGKDLEILSESFQVTGSDNSQIFLNYYKHQNQNADLILLDAKTLKTDRKFDCIFSNKVLHHLTKDDLKNSFAKQKELLNPYGILFHTFWLGSNQEQFQDLHFIQYQVDEIKNLIQNYKLIEIDLYEEMNINDSFYVILQAN